MIQEKSKIKNGRRKTTTNKFLNKKELPFIVPLKSKNFFIIVNINYLINILIRMLIINNYDFGLGPHLFTLS